MFTLMYGFMCLVSECMVWNFKTGFYTMLGDALLGWLVALFNL
jgi:hypothetical protein